MVPPVKILTVQAKSKTGDLDYNFDLVYKAYTLAQSEQLDLCIFPELVTTDYMCEDLFLKPSFILYLQRKIVELTNKIKNTALLLPTPFLEDGKLYNAVIGIQNKMVVGKSFKKHLPNYGIFDEKRYFTSGEPQIIEINGKKIGVPICEDIWFPDVCLQLKSLGAEMLFVSNASPYEKGKLERRLILVKQRFKETNLPIIYCNRVLGQDGIIFDGRSFAYDGEIKYVLSIFKEDAQIIEIDNNNRIIGNSIATFQEIPVEDELYGAMVLGLREYLSNNMASSVVIGLSGGIDSALVAAIAVDAIGAENVKAIMLPSQFTSQESLEDAESIAKILNIAYEVIPIRDIVETAKNNIGQISNLAYENLQSRSRGMILMAISNSTSSLLLTTGNKSENATGYATLYGDMCGAFNPVKDIYKTDLFRVAKFRNSNIPTSIEIKNAWYPIMPERVITKPPSAELRENQKDSDSLPEYELLDEILNLYIEQNLGIEEIIDLGFDEQIVKRIAKLVKDSEFKRQQSAPGVKLSIRNFEKDRRYPITNGYL
jgi:NAD+ synthase